MQIQSKEKLHASQVLSPRDYASPAKKLEPALIEPLTSEIKRKKSEDFDCDMIEEDPNNLCNYIYSTILPENSKSPQDNPPISVNFCASPSNNNALSDFISHNKEEPYCGRNDWFQ